MWIIKNQKKLQQFYITQSHRHIPGSSLPGGNTWFSPLADPSCSRRGWLTSVETMDMWWLFWTMLCSLPFGSEKKPIHLAFGGLNMEGIIQQSKNMYISIRTSILTSLSDSKRIWSYSDKATKKMIDVTFSKQWIHFRRSDRWPPTSTILKCKRCFEFQVVRSWPT